MYFCSFRMGMGLFCVYIHAHVGAQYEAREICMYYHIKSNYFLHLWLLLYACMRPCDWEPRRAEEVWVGVNDSDIITACRLVLFQCPDTDRSSIVPALRGLPRFPCVRNHPPTCYSRQGPKTMKLYTESLWAAGRALMKDSVTAERITNARLLDTVLYTHTHTHKHSTDTYTHTHISMQVHTGGGQTHTHTVTLQTRRAQT